MEVMPEEEKRGEIKEEKEKVQMLKVMIQIKLIQQQIMYLIRKEI